jgi:undecaprenyl-diphosphatase
MTAPVPEDRPAEAGLRLWPLLVGLVLVWLAMLLVGGSGVDQAILRGAHVSEQPWLAPVNLFTSFGDWQLLVGATFLAAGWLLYRRRLRLAAFLLASTLLGRALVGVQKLALGRVRPEQDNPFVVVDSFAFPSDHAANSMIVCLLLVLLLVGNPRRRTLAAVAAVLVSLLIGISRVLLGVHWPSDVVGGWAFGLLWVLSSVRLWRSGALERV